MQGTGVKARRNLQAGQVIMTCQVQTLPDVAAPPGLDVAPDDHCMVFDPVTQTWFVVGDHCGPRCAIYYINSSVGPAARNCELTVRPLPPSSSPHAHLTSPS